MTAKNNSRIQQPDPPATFVVERRSTRAGGDDRPRESIIVISKLCNALFGARLHGTVATLANVAFQQTNFTKEHVRSVVRQPGRDDGGGINVLLSLTLNATLLPQSAGDYFRLRRKPMRACCQTKKAPR